jgi:hypothetical protein
VTVLLECSHEWLSHWGADFIVVPKCIELL